MQKAPEGASVAAAQPFSDLAAARTAFIDGLSNALQEPTSGAV